MTSVSVERTTVFCPGTAFDSTLRWYTILVSASTCAHTYSCASLCSTLPAKLLCTVLHVPQTTVFCLMIAEYLFSFHSSIKNLISVFLNFGDLKACLKSLGRTWSAPHCKKKSVQCTPNMVCYVCPNWNTLYGVKSHHILGVCLTPNWVCFHTNSVCFPTNFSVFSHSL